jgi:hypothetical protein
VAQWYDGAVRWWHDDRARYFHCAWYASDTGGRCRDYGDSNPNFGMTANVACCACGGGEQRTCANMIPNTNGVSAKDSEGRDCVYWDLAPENWLPWCSSFDDDDFTASDFCCACGGGQQLV